MQRNIKAWFEFLETYSGVTFMLDHFWVGTDQLEVFIDTAGSSDKGVGTLFQGLWAYACGPEI